jgi:hypothetical protein
LKSTYLRNLSLGIVATLLFAGCSTTTAPTPSKTDDVTPTQARENLTELFDVTQKRVGGDWTVSDEATPFECDTADGGKGVQFLLTRLGSAPGSMAAAEAHAKTVAELFESSGYPTNTQFQEEIGYDVVGQDDERSVITFGANDKAMSLQGGSSCVLGDIDSLRDQINDGE